MSQQNKLKALETYKGLIQGLLQSPVPKKHTNRPDTYKNYLNKELEVTTRKIEDIKLGASR